MNATELFDELRAQYPGRWHRGQLMAFRNRVRLWREDARARGVEIGRLQYRQSSKPRTRRRPDPLEAHWAEMLQCLEADPDQTSQELLAAFGIQYPDRYHAGHLRYGSTPNEDLATSSRAKANHRNGRTNRRRQL